MRKLSPSSSPGFTIIELVMVLGIIALLSGIAAPRYFQSIVQYKAELCARRIAADLSLARSQALSTSASQTLSFDIAANRYTMANVASLDLKSPTYTLSLAADPYNASLVSVNLGGSTQVTFDAWGSADRSGQIVVQCQGIQRIIILEASCGKATVP